MELKVKERRKKFDFSIDNESTIEHIKTIKPEDYNKYNITPKTELEILKNGMETADYNTKMMAGGEKDFDPNCGDCSRCHEGAPVANYGWWSVIAFDLLGYEKQSYLESASSSDQCLDMIKVIQWAYANYQPAGSVARTNYDDYLAAVGQIFRYPYYYSYIWEVDGYHEWDDYDYDFFAATSEAWGLF
jgi:hypothetical protein